MNGSKQVFFELNRDVLGEALEKFLRRPLVRMPLVPTEEETRVAIAIALTVRQWGGPFSVLLTAEEAALSAPDLLRVKGIADLLSSIFNDAEHRLLHDVDDADLPEHRSTAEQKRVATRNAIDAGLVREIHSRWPD